MPPPPAPMMAIAVVLLFVFTWPAGIPLTAALRRLHSHSRFATYACTAVLGPLTAAAATVGGVLGPIAVWSYASVLSLPAWLVLWLFRVAGRRGAPHPGR